MKPLTKSFVTVPLTDLKPYENNPRQNRQAVEKTAESIRQVDYISPIVVDEDNVVLAGHTRMSALSKLGRTEAEVLRVTGLTKEAKKKFRLLDNRTQEFASWDLEKLELELKDIDFGKVDFGWDAVLKAPEQIPGMDPPFGEKDGAGDGQYLCIGRIRLPLSDEEFSLLQHLGRQYIDAYGREPGFVGWLQGQLG